MFLVGGGVNAKQRGVLTNCEPASHASPRGIGKKKGNTSKNCKFTDEELSTHNLY